MEFHVTWLAESYAVADDQTEVGVVGEPFDVMSVKIPTSCISTVCACESIAHEDIESPALVFTTESYAASFCCQSIFEIGGSGSSDGPFAGALANKRSGFQGVFLSKTRALVRTSSPSLSHLLTRLIGHRFALHGGNERRAPGFPSDAHLCLRFFGMSHATILSRWRVADG